MGISDKCEKRERYRTKQGYYRFVAIFTWAGQDDKVALERLKPYIGHNFPDEMGIDSETVQSYYLTGARTDCYWLYQVRGGAAAILFVDYLRHGH